MRKMDGYMVELDVFAGLITIVVDVKSLIFIMWAKERLVDLEMLIYS